MVCDREISLYNVGRKRERKRERKKYSYTLFFSFAFQTISMRKKVHNEIYLLNKAYLRLVEGCLFVGTRCDDSSILTSYVTKLFSFLENP